MEKPQSGRKREHAMLRVPDLTVPWHWFDVLLLREEPLIGIIFISSES
jgi:hypothetical protein